ncbi:MAG: FAD-binding oxidoreductase [Synechococcales cyanobacterium T60_A2020_003]|nr:FAD-binding oxidoreductase [Synechococcales cyanobacterium T60_A2020_003]
MTTGTTEQLLASLPGTLNNLRRADRLWESYKTRSRPVPNVITTASTPLESPDWDVVICGGTLGIMLGGALVRQGWRVALIERGMLRGRDQEWNISRKELQVLVDLELLTAADLEAAIATEYNPAWVKFPDGMEIAVEDVLNIGVDPVYLLDRLKATFLANGGKLLEQMAFTGATVHPNGVAIATESDGTPHTLTTRLMIDMMGHFSPIAQQARKGQTPDAVCMVVGTCAEGFPENETGDLFASFTPIQNQCQYFWEAFPARDGRTTYLFTYVDAEPSRPSLEDLFDEYWRLLPEYQSVSLDQLTIKRALFGFFPSYRNSPLRSPWDRVLFAGDSSGVQSPLSFGGFGAMLRHLQRLTTGIHDALSQDLLTRNALAALQPYQPNLSVTWLFQKSMSVGVHQTLSPDHVNRVLSAVFGEMAQLGDGVLKPFLQDVVQFSPLAQTLFWTGLRHPLLITRILPQVGLPALLDWMKHYVNLGVYTALAAAGHQISPLFQQGTPRLKYYGDRQLEAWMYGSGQED